MTENQAEAPQPNTAPCADPVVVVGGFLIVDGCKVARIEPGGVIAFQDKCRRRCSQRGADQVRVSVDALAEVVLRHPSASSGCQAQDDASERK